MAALTAEQVAAATGAPVANVRAHWPLVLQELKRAGADSLSSQIAAAATVGVETGGFRPIDERPSAANDNFARYEPGTSVGRRLGNTQVGDGAKYKGRGLIQLTGRENYKNYGRLLGVDLLNHPELANRPDVAARIFAAYWTGKAIHRVADQQNWREVRRLVNGGTNGLDVFLRQVDALLPRAVADVTAVRPPVTTGPSVTPTPKVGVSKAAVVAGGSSIALLLAALAAFLLGRK